jgi:hypothetical protein
MSKFKQSSAKSKASSRRGAAFLLLVMMVLLVILAATQWLVTSSVAYRKGEIDQLRSRTMIAALDRAQAVAGQESLRLPIDDASDERIEITRPADGASITAVWLRGNKEISRIIRPARAEAGSSPAADK